jgi:defect-in-organelle-trafficking protein DotC
MTLDEAQRLYQRPAIVQPASPDGQGDDLQAGLGGARNEAQKARAQALLDTALGIGLKAGLAWQLRNIRIVVNGMSRDLDLLYNFNTLMIHQRVVPPVVSEARDLYNQEGDYALRLSGAFYKIERQAAFASVSPSWRGYLSFPKVTLDSSNLISLLTPANEAERAVWRAAVKNGWNQGVEQANIMLTQGMDRLNRDFGGMSRFQLFVIEGKLSLPAIAREDIPLTQTGGTMAVDETLLRITTLPQFNLPPSRWQGIITSAKAPLAHCTPAVVAAGSRATHKIP